MKISGNAKMKDEVSTAYIHAHFSQAVTMSTYSANRYELWLCPDRREEPPAWPTVASYQLLPLIEPSRNSSPQCDRCTLL